MGALTTSYKRKRDVVSISIGNLAVSVYLFDKDNKCNHYIVYL